ncbi:hypothetical protein Tsubulata_035051 [Turnera subulata]|uniref:CCHC-type domain-containing protein n=1 Tax=Turnera subulata TaxID=218843 RepID=A0A9Q0FXC2_9ROSI|nr:hypothetical protein Tsubulata_035051 [Turnera subulata]
MSALPPQGGGGTVPSTSPPQETEPAKSFRDTVAQGSAWNEPTIETDFVFEAGVVVVTSSPQGPIVRYTKSFCAKLHKNWENTLIIKPWGRTIGYKALSSRLSRLWQSGSGFKLVVLEQNYFMVKFYLHSLAVEHYHLGVLKLVCDQIERTVRIDIPTQQTDRVQFARIAVELDLTKALEARVCFEDIWYHIEYEDLPQICFDCGMAGHNMSACPSRGNGNDASMAAQAPMTTDSAGLAGSNEKGSPKKKGNPGASRSSQLHGVGGSRFDVLADTTEDDISVEPTNHPLTMPRTNLTNTPAAVVPHQTTRRNKGKVVVGSQSGSGSFLKRTRRNEDTFTPVLHTTAPAPPSTSSTPSSVKVLLKHNPESSSRVALSSRVNNNPFTASDTPGKLQFQASTPAAPSFTPTVPAPQPSLSKNQGTGLDIAFDQANKGHVVLNNATSMDSCGISNSSTDPNASMIQVQPGNSRVSDGDHEMCDSTA